MNSQVMIELGIGFIVGAVVCLSKEFLLQRFILRGSTVFTMLLFWVRFAINATVMIIMCCYSVEALIGSALGLSIYPVIALVKVLREKR